MAQKVEAAGLHRHDRLDQRTVAESRGLEGPAGLSGKGAVGTVQHGLHEIAVMIHDDPLEFTTVFSSAFTNLSFTIAAIGSFVLGFGLLVLAGYADQRSELAWVIFWPFNLRHGR